MSFHLKSRVKEKNKKTEIVHSGLLPHMTPHAGWPTLNPGGSSFVHFPLGYRGPPGHQQRAGSELDIHDRYHHLYGRLWQQVLHHSANHRIHFDVSENEELNAYPLTIVRYLGLWMFTQPVPQVCIRLDDNRLIQSIVEKLKMKAKVRARESLHFPYVLAVSETWAYYLCKSKC